MEELNKYPVGENGEKLTLLEFASMVRQMRFNQRRYFKTRKPETLETCKKLEKQIDELVEIMFDTQLNLF